MGDITKGYTFTDGLENDCSAAHLHQLIESGAINTTFHTGKASAGANPDMSALEVMLYRTSDTTFVKVGVDALLAENQTFIHARTAKTVPVAADELLLSDSAASYANKRMTVANLLYGAAALAAPVAADYVPLYDTTNSALKRLTLSDLIAGGAELSTVDGAEKMLVLTGAGALRWSRLRNFIENAAAQAAGLGGTEQIGLYTAAGTTWKKCTLLQLLTLQGAVAAPDDADIFLLGQIAGAVTKKVTGTNLRKYAQGGYVLIRDEKASGANGGALASGSWLTRTLNTESADGLSVASVAANQVTLTAGTYRFRGVAPGFQVGVHQCRLRNITAGSTVAVGTTARSGAADNVVSYSEVTGRVVLAGATVLELQHRVGTTNGTDGGGSAGSLDATNNEVYSTLEFWRED